VILVVAGSLAAVHRVPDGSVGLLDSFMRGPQVLEPGIHVSVPGVESIRVLDPYVRDGTLVFVTPEGARLDLQLRVALRLVPGAVRQTWAGFDPHDPLERLDRVVDAIVTGRLRELTEGSVPRLDDAQRASIAEALSKLGELEGPLVLDYLPDSPMATKLRSSREWQRIRELEHPTGVRMLVIGLDGMDWQIAEPLIERGLMPNLATLRDGGAWGNVKALVPILSPLLWTSVATGVTPERHGVVDFLVTDPKTGEQVPIDSRFRKVRALWNIFTEAERSVDVVAWWASWPAEPVSGHLISDRLSYSLFDVQTPAAGRGLTWPPEYFDAVRPELVTDDAIGYRDVARFVDIDEEEFAALRSRIEIDREAAYREPVNHLTKILAATRNYHRIALDLLADDQAELTAVYYQFLDEVCHRFMHFSLPPMDGVDPRDVRRYGKTVESAYVWQDELLGELLAAADPATTVIALSDHGFLNGPDRIAGETADVEGKPGRWHRRYGVLVLAGPPVARREMETASLLDIAPTVLYLAGLPVADDMDGRVLREAFKPEFVERYPPTRIASYEHSPRLPGVDANGDVVEASNEGFLENLRSLGYVGGGSTSRAESVASASVSSHVNLAASWIASGELDRAEEEIRVALQIDPQHLGARKLQFNVYYRQRRFEEAIAVSRMLLAGPDPDDPRLVTRVARAYRRTGRLEEGIREYRDRVGRGETQLQALLCRLLFEAGQLEAALATARSVLATEPLNEAAMDTAFNVAMRQGRAQDVEPLLRAALEANPRSVAHLNYLSFVRESQGDVSDAERLLRDALGVDPEDGASLVNLGRLYLRVGRNREAEELLRKALAAHPDNDDARELLERLRTGVND
jgi:predicted AlkP superfamily phosphohydrolase/phosphomutase/tetratricopeptide (TPR) repeat protein